LLMYSTRMPKEAVELTVETVFNLMRYESPRLT